MITIDTIVLACIIIAALLGYIFGFGRTLKWFTGGIVGIIISIVACIMLGGIFQNIPAIGGEEGFIMNINQKASGVWGGFGANFLGYFAGQAVFYAMMFLAVMLLRIIIVRLVKKIMQSENKVFGVIFMTGFVCAIILVILAGMKTLGIPGEDGLYSEESFINGLIRGLDGRVLKTVFDNNPIKFVT